MLEFSEIMKRIKRVIYEEKRDRVYDKEVAKALGLKPSHYAVIKKRERIPYEAIALFADKKNISLNWILFHKENVIIPSIK